MCDNNKTTPYTFTPPHSFVYNIGGTYLFVSMRAFRVWMYTNDKRVSNRTNTKKRERKRREGWAGRLWEKLYKYMETQAQFLYIAGFHSRHQRRYVYITVYSVLWIHHIRKRLNLNGYSSSTKLTAMPSDFIGRDLWTGNFDIAQVTRIFRYWSTLEMSSETRVIHFLWNGNDKVPMLMLRPKCMLAESRSQCKHTNCMFAVIKYWNCMYLVAA